MHVISLIVCSTSMTVVKGNPLHLKNYVVTFHLLCKLGIGQDREIIIIYAAPKKKGSLLREGATLSINPIFSKKATSFLFIKVSSWDK